MFFGITQKDTVVRVDIDDASLPEGVDQFVVLDKVKEMLEYWSHFGKFSLHIQKPVPLELLQQQSSIPPQPNP
jgi:hypothetical protein